MPDAAEPDASITDVQESGSVAPESDEDPDGGTPWWRRWLVAALVLGGLGAAVYVAGDIPKTNGHYGFWSVLPPLIAIVLASLASRRAASLRGRSTSSTRFCCRPSGRRTLR
jgi:peptidoglycan/LPS O-acetylase OafA/YrhL